MLSFPERCCGALCRVSGRASGQAGLLLVVQSLTSPVARRYRQRVQPRLVLASVKCDTSQVSALHSLSLPAARWARALLRAHCTHHCAELPLGPIEPVPNLCLCSFPIAKVDPNLEHSDCAEVLTPAILSHLLRVSISQGWRRLLNSGRPSSSLARMSPRCCQSTFRPRRLLTSMSSS